jgi:hypothetical protein
MTQAASADQSLPQSNLENRAGTSLNLEKLLRQKPSLLSRTSSRIWGDDRRTG